jgi:hypothetical protein
MYNTPPIIIILFKILINQRQLYKYLKLNKKEAISVGRVTRLAWGLYLSDSSHPFLFGISGCSSFLCNGFGSNVLTHFMVVVHLSKNFSFHFSLSISNK